MPSLRAKLQPCLRPYLRPALGFIIAPIMPGVLIGGPIWLCVDRMGGQSLLMLSAILGYPTALVAGVPLYLLLRWRRWTGLLPTLAAGALQGVVVFVFFVAVTSNATNIMRRFYTTSALLAFAIPLSMLAALCFWLIVRPDRMAGGEQHDQHRGDPVQ